MNPQSNGSVISNSITTQPMERQPTYPGYVQYMQQPYQAYPQQPIYQQRSYTQQPYPTMQQHPTVDFSQVQLMIEQYLQFYYTNAEIAHELEKKNVPKETTNYILEKLEEQNPDYFRAYGYRLRAKEQISRFSELIQRHTMMMSQLEQQQMQQPQQVPPQAPPQHYHQEIYPENYGGSYISGNYQGEHSMGGL